MRNYISVNAKYYKMGEIDRISNHNFRQSKIDYLLPKEQIKFKNKNIVFNENFQATNQDLSLKNLDFAMRSQFLKLLELKKNILKKNNAKHRKNENQLIEMVVALSEEQAKFYLENGVDLMAGFENFAKNIEAKHGLKPLAISLHLDEGNTKDNVTKVNVHAHLTFFNYHFEKEKSVLRTLQKQDFKEMQDIAANSFQDVGLNFVRGEGKEITNKKHIERNDFILAKQTLELKQQIVEVNKLKNEEKELLKNLEKGTLEYDEKYKEIGILQQQEKDLRTKVKELSLNTPKDFTKVVSDLTNNLVNKHIEKTILGNKVINNIDDLKKDIYKELKNTQNSKLTLKENEALKQENQALKQENQEKDKIIEDKDSVIEKVSTEKYQERSKNKVLEQENLSQKNEMTKLKENHTLELNRVKNDLKRKFEQRVKRLKLINRLKRSNIANKVRNRLAKNLSNNKTRDR